MTYRETINRGGSRPLARKAPKGAAAAVPDPASPAVAVPDSDTAGGDGAAGGEVKPAGRGAKAPAVIKEG